MVSKACTLEAMELNTYTPAPRMLDVVARPADVIVSPDSRDLLGFGKRPGGLLIARADAPTSTLPAFALLRMTSAQHPPAPIEQTLPGTHQQIGHVSGLRIP